MQSNFSLQTGLFNLPCMSEFIEHQARNLREKTLSIYMMTCCSKGSCPGLAFVPLQKPIQRHKTKSPTKNWRSWSPEAVSSCLISSLCTNMSLLRETGLQTEFPSPTSHGRNYLWPWGWTEGNFPSAQSTAAMKWLWVLHLLVTYFLGILVKARESVFHLLYFCWRL